jgi:hypothetical protein
MRFLAPLLAASLIALAVAVETSGETPSSIRAPHLGAGPGLRSALAPAHPAARPAPRVRCERPRTLRLHRFEDRSARLECAGRILVRVSVPG